MTEAQIEEMKEVLLEQATEEARTYKTRHPLTGKDFARAINLIKLHSGLTAHILQFMTDFANEYVKKKDVDFPVDQAKEVQTYMIEKTNELVDRYGYK